MKFAALAVFIGVFIKQSLSYEIEEECDKRLLQHYYVKGCEPIYEPRSSVCPTWFECPEHFFYDTRNACPYNKDIFYVDDNITAYNPCQVCACKKATTFAHEVRCKDVECPYACKEFEKPDGEKCYDVYDRDSCCPIEIKCGRIYPLPTVCIYQGRTYFFGERINTENEDPCMLCTCGEGWTGDIRQDYMNCKKIECVLEKDAEKLKQGCVPIYPDLYCCPGQYYCGENFPEEPETATAEDVLKGMACSVPIIQKYYQKGQKFEVHLRGYCLHCECTTPPELTCTHEFMR